MSEEVTVIETVRYRNDDGSVEILPGEKGIVLDGKRVWDDAPNIPHDGMMYRVFWPELGKIRWMMSFQLTTRSS